MHSWIDPFSSRLLSGAGKIPASQGRGPLVLMYHSISAKKIKPADKWCISLKNFKHQLHLLKSKGWTTATVGDLLKIESLPHKTVVISFDDGYEDNFENAFRLLADYGMVATWFIVSKKIGKPNRLDVQQIKEMANSGMEIGAHTRNHLRLPELKEKEIEEEIWGSKNDLEELLCKKIESFAYPYGLYDETCVNVVKKAGFKIACTTRNGWFGSEPDLFKIRRVAVFPEDSLSSFARKLAFAGADVRWRRMFEYMVMRLKCRIYGYERG
jgi:peptidoglycan/xylan/chitin deacetylase (PgdA/CDA1 family)